MATNARAIVNDVLGPNMTREIWSGNYEKALPISIQDFDLPSVLPAVFYMFRFAHRRGKGEFLETFGNKTGTLRERRRSATIDRIADELSRVSTLDGFGDENTQAVLGDLLLSFCLENSKRALGRREQVQRVAPAHYMAGWVDLPDQVVNLRYVPEMIVAMLADQPGEYVEQNREGDRPTWFSVGLGFEKNVLLKAFHQGVTWDVNPYETRKGDLSSRTADRFDEATEVGLDQLLMIRLAQQLGAAPDKLRGSESARISNQHPIAEQAARQFSEDIRRFVRDYAQVIPRHAFVELLEACMAVGLTTILTGTIELLFAWADSGVILSRQEQKATSLFIDCSNNVDLDLRSLAEQSMDDFMRRVERFPVILMALRLLDYYARYDPGIRKLDISTRPYATEWLNVLGDLLYDRRDEARLILFDLERKCQQLSEALQEEYPDIAEDLVNGSVQANPVWRLAESLTALQGRGNTQSKLIKLVDSVLLIDRPNGLATKRTVTRTESLGSGTKRREVRSMILTDSALDYLVHRHVLRNGRKEGYRALSYGRFLDELYERHDFCIDRAPAGMAISSDWLQRNRLVLERRLRELGLLVGVNDAETMKLLKPRFQRFEEDNDVD